MANIQDVVNYISAHYPDRQLSKARLIKIIYLADWESAIERNKQLTSLKWSLGACGLIPDQDIELPKPPRLFLSYPSLKEQEKELLDHAIKTSAKKSGTDFLSLVYSTYPILNQSGTLDKELDLTRLAAFYREIRNDF